MSHYWTSDDHPAEREAQIADWIEDLVEFPIWAIEEACRAWRQSKSRRPTPAEIRALAIEAQHKALHARQQNPERALALPPSRSPQKLSPNSWEPGFADRYDEPWFRHLPVEQQQRLMEQDLDRAAAWRSVEEGKITGAAFVSLCVQQLKENLASSNILNNPLQSHNKSRSAIERVWSELGVSAQESAPHTEAAE